ncbi:heterokaryon incompatibility protein-domain-containing protein [Nemania sp. NC0429]|nr:heterokaryon incompatibility protein-domain-containing protein [Nemania sp. NC0429]
MDTLYSTLPSAHHIRVLQLERNDSIDASLHVVDLDTQPEYTCLSYTWGGPRWEDEDEDWALPNRTLLANGYSLDIGRNLRNALDHLHGTLAGRAIWIDAVCINQREGSERNAQVALMDRIYEQASNVVVWLGEASPAWETAIKNMDRFALTLEGYWEAFPAVHKPWNDAFVACEFTDEEHVDIIHFLTGNRWFSRIWTLQEHILARDIRFLCGDAMAPLETIWKGSMIATLAGVTTAWADLDVSREEWNKEFMTTVGIRYRFADEPKESIGINAHKYRSRQATDPKDKVFGVFGISRTTDKWIEEPFLVDYSLSVQEVYTKAAAYGLVAWKGLEALCHVGDKKNGEKAMFKAASNLESEFYLHSVKEKAVVFIASPIDSVISTCDAYWKSREKQGMPNFLKLLLQPSRPATPYNENLASIFLRLLVADGFKNEGIDPRKNLTQLFERWLFSRLFDCDEAHRGETGSAVAFWHDPKSRISPMAEALGIECHLLEELLESISRGAKQCTTVDDIELGLVGRDHGSGAHAQYMQSMRHALAVQWEFTGMNRRFFRTSLGYVGIGPRTVEVGDRVMLLQGAHVPYIFRHLPKDPETVFDFVGEAYLHGFMYGEGLERDGIRWEKITVY